MAERTPTSRANAPAILTVRGLNVYYGSSHALQGVDLTLTSGVLSVVGRNGMGKTTLCKTIMGLVRASSGSIRFGSEELTRRSPADIARLGIGYVPQGRRLWPSLTVDEHLRMTANNKGGWSVERVYDTFPRLAERKTNRGGQLSGGEQQMVAISRALLLNPKLLVMDEPTEGLAPVIVAQVEEMLIQLGHEGEIAILVIEQNIGVATEISEQVAIMVNGRVNRLVDAKQLAADRDLQQRLLGVGRHGHEDAPADTTATATSPDARRASGPVRVYVSNPQPPTRWSADVPIARIEAAARTTSGTSPTSTSSTVGHTSVALRPLAASGEPVVLIAGTLDTKGAELRFIRDLLKDHGVRTRLVDLSTSGKVSGADVTPLEIAMNHRRGVNGVLTGDRGASVAAMAEAFEAWVRRQQGIAGIIAAGGSGGTSMVAPAMRSLPVGVPKIMISTVASGDVARYVGPSDIMMMYSVTDVAGLNAISRQVLANGAQAMAGMVKARAAAMKDARGRTSARPELPAIGLTMFGVTTPCIEHVTALLKDEYDCLVFHATGVGGRSMEKLVESGMLAGVLDLTTTEIPDLLMGGVMAATEDRFGAMIRARMPYVGSVGAVDMVNFGARDTVPVRYEGRLFYPHNPQVTLMRTTPDENERIGKFIGDRLNEMTAPVRFLLPEGGVSALDAPGRPFWNPDALNTLFTTLEKTVRQTATRQLVRVPAHINDPIFAKAAVDAFRAINGATRGQRRRAGK